MKKNIYVHTHDSEKITVGPFKSVLMTFMLIVLLLGSIYAFFSIISSNFTNNTARTFGYGLSLFFFAGWFLIAKSIVWFWRGHDYVVFHKEFIEIYINYIIFISKNKIALKDIVEISVKKKRTSLNPSTDFVFFNIGEWIVRISDGKKVYDLGFGLKKDEAEHLKNSIDQRIKNIITQ